MRMVPIYSVTGQLLGHLNWEHCHATCGYVTVTDTPPTLYMFRENTVSAQLNFIRLALKQITFRNGYDETHRTCVVATENLPEWFWDVGKAVKFSPEHWRSA